MIEKIEQSQQPANENAAPQPMPMADAEIAVPDASILHEIETATETMALYTAIIGKRPEIVDPSADPSMLDGPPPILTISPSWPQVNRQMISIWFRRMSIHARKRIDEALLRIAG